MTDFNSDFCWNFIATKAANWKGDYFTGSFYLFFYSFRPKSNPNLNPYSKTNPKSNPNPNPNSNHNLDP